MKAREIMSLEVVSVDPDASILEAVRLMLQNRISGLPVVDSQGMLVGMVTDGDFLRRVERPVFVSNVTGVRPERLAV